MTLVPPRAVLFDLDGTLVDTLDDVAAALNAALGELALPPVATDTIRAGIGPGVTDLICRALAAAGTTSDEAALAALQSAFLEHYRRQPALRSRLYPHAKAALEHLAARGIRLGLCTNKLEALSRAVLDALELTPIFEAAVFGDTLARRKPDPAPVRFLLDRLGVSAADTVLVGDTTSDEQAARRAGIRFVAAEYGYGDLAAGTGDAEIGCLRELPAALGVAR